MLACLMCAMMVFAFIPSVCAEDVATPDEAESTEGSGETGDTGGTGETGDTGDTGDTGNTGKPEGGASEKDEGDTDEGCSHTNTVYENRHFDWKNSKVTSFNDTVHVITANMIANKKCSACGTVVEYNAVVEENVQLTEKHTFNAEGKCEAVGCGATGTGCQHDGKTYEDTRFTYGRSTPVTAWNNATHTVPGTEIVTTYCSKCNTQIGEPVERDAEQQIPHSIQNGKCVQEGCGYEGEGCGHEHPKTETDEILQRNQKSLGHDQHEYFVDVVEYTGCDDCMMLISEKIIEEGRRKVENHEFVNGKCVICGETEHPERKTKREYSQLRDIKSVDEDSHSFTADVTTVETCMDCGYVTTTKAEAVTGIVEKHDFNEDGQCELCGYCSHLRKDNTDTVIESTVGYNNNGDTHEKYWNIHRFTKCAVCGEVLKDEDILGEENRETEANLPHDFSTGVCVCGKACPHTETVYVNRHFDWKNSKVTSYNDTVHVITANMIANKKCSACGTVVEYNAVVEENVQLTEKHTFNAEGKCEAVGCGATGTGCQHDGKTYEDTRFTYGRSTPVTAWNNATHTVPGTEIVTTYCSKCNTQIGEPVERDAEQQIPHSIQNGKCVQEGCGYEGEGCGHEHPKTETDEILQRNQKSLGHDQHEYFVDVVEYTGCDDCMTLLSEEILQEGLRKVENHEFVNGVCVVCGQTEHPNHTTKQEYGQMDIFAPVDAQTHSFLADVYEVVTCADCGTVLSRKLVASAAPQTGEHTFGEDGRCEYCRYCTHKTTLKRTIDMEGSERYEDSGDGKTHIKTWDVLEETYCALCGVVVNQRILDDSAQENHSFGSGICACGLSCPHTNTKDSATRIDISNAQVVSYNEVSHVLKTDIFVHEICQDCYRIAGEKVVEAGVLMSASHELDSEGKCRDCGYVPTCKHEHIGQDVEYDDYRSTATQWDAQGHTVVADMTVFTYCEDCHTLLSRKTTTSEPIVLPHRFVVGLDTCTVSGCEAKNECAHSKTVEEIHYNNSRNYVSLGSGEHQFTAEVVETVYCEACGVLLSSEAVESKATVTEEHTFLKGVCMNCGESEPLPTATPDEATPVPTVKPTPAPTATPEPDIDYEPTSRPNRTPAPVVTPVATAAPTVAPTPEPERKPIVETLFEAIVEAEAEGKEVEVEIVGAQEVMTQEEYTELRTLTAQEQVLVTLKTVGLDEVVQAAVAAMNVTVSGEAQSLMDKVGARQETMTAEERTAYEDKLAEYFPMTERVIDGVTVRTFTIDMKVVVDGYERVERYQFYLDENGEWVFEKVDLASFGRA